MRKERLKEREREIGRKKTLSWEKERWRTGNRKNSKRERQGG